MNFTHFVILDTTAKDNGMEVFPINDVKKMLDRVSSIIGEPNDLSKEMMGNLMDNRLDDVFTKLRGFVAVPHIVMCDKNCTRDLHIYLASSGK